MVGLQWYPEENLGGYGLKCSGIRATFGVGPGQGSLPQPRQGPELLQVQDVLSQGRVSHGEPGGPSGRSKGSRELGKFGGAELG